MNNTAIEVRLSDLLAMMLKACKLILCTILALGILGAAYGAYSFIKSHPKVTQADVEAAETNVHIAEMNLVKAQRTLSFRDEVKIPGLRQRVDRIEQMVLRMQDYMNGSIYYNMNPYHRGAARLRFTVETNQIASPMAAVATSDPRVEIVISYTQMCPFGSETLEQVKKIMGVEVELQYIEELISVTSDDDHQVVEVCMLYDDLSVAEQITEYLYQTLRAHADESLPEHQVTVLAAFTGYEVDMDMSRNHAINESNLNNAEIDLKNANDSLEALTKGDTTEEQVVANAESALDSARSSLSAAQYYYAKNRPSLRSLAKRTIKYGLLSGIVGLMLGCCIALGKGLFGGVIQNQNEVMSRYAFPLIGVLPRTKKQWFDATIRKLEGESTSSFDATAQATAQSLLARIGEKHVCLVSTGDGAVARKLAAYTDDAIPVVGSIIDSADAVKELSKYEGIVLVEERGKSRVDLVDAEVLRAKALNKEIIGIVLA